MFEFVSDQNTPFQRRGRGPLVQLWAGGDTQLLLELLLQDLRQFGSLLATAMVLKSDNHRIV